MKIRNGLIVGVAAFACAQTASAASAPASLDPLVAVSAFGTPQSHAAVAPALAGTAAVQGAVAGPPPGWPANQYPQPNQYYRNAWIFIPGLIGLLAIILFATSDHDHHRVPASPF
jgi:hypothetical protein